METGKNVRLIEWMCFLWALIPAFALAIPALADSIVLPVLPATTSIFAGFGDVNTTALMPYVGSGSTTASGTGSQKWVFGSPAPSILSGTSFGRPVADAITMTAGGLVLPFDERGLPAGTDRGDETFAISAGHWDALLRLIPTFFVRPALAQDGAPEPASLAILGAGVAGWAVVWFRRNRKR